MISRAVRSLFQRTLHVFPARDERLDAADSFDGNLVFIDGGADALKAFDVGFRIEALISIRLRDEDKASTLVETNCLDRDTQLVGYESDWVFWSVFIRFLHTCNYKYNYDAIGHFFGVG